MTHVHPSGDGMHGMYILRLMFVIYGTITRPSARISRAPRP